MTPTLGKALLPILEGLEEALWQVEADFPNHKHGFNENALRAASKIFMATLLDQMWEKQEREDMSQRKREDMAKYFGEELHQLILDATDIDTKKMYS